MTYFYAQQEFLISPQLIINDPITYNISTLMNNPF